MYLELAGRSYTVSSTRSYYVNYSDAKTCGTSLLALK